MYLLSYNVLISIFPSKNTCETVQNLAKLYSKYNLHGCLYTSLYTLFAVYRRIVMEIDIT